MNSTRHNLFLSIILMVSLWACKTESGNKQVGLEDKLKDHVDLKINDTYTAQSSKAAAILEYRYEQEGRESYAAIEMDRWYYEFKAFGDQISPCTNGEYIDFLPDLSYEYGTSDEKLGEGRYHYNLETGIVLLVDNNAKIKPREYEVKIAGPTMVLQGEPTYGDNVFQAKLMMDHVNRPQSSSSK